MAGQFPGMGGGGISQNNSYMMQQQAAPQAGGVGVFTSQPGDGGSFGGQVTSFSGYPSSQPGLSQAGPGGYPNPPAYSQSGGGGGGAYSLASSYMSSSYGAQSPVYSQSVAAARPQMSVSPAGFPGPAGPFQHHYQQAGFQQQQQQQQQQQGPAGFASMQGFPSPQPQFSQSMQQQQLQAQFAMQQQQQQQQQQGYSALHQQQANLPTQTMMTSGNHLT